MISTNPARRLPKTPRAFVAIVAVVTAVGPAFARQTPSKTSGQIIAASGQCPNLTLTLATGTRVKTSGTTEFRVPCGQLRSGTRIDAYGGSQLGVVSASAVALLGAAVPAPQAPPPSQPVSTVARVNPPSLSPSSSNRGPVAAPTASPAGGNYLTPVAVALTTGTAGATIRYTTNGSEPSAWSTLYNGPLTISKSTLLKARAFKGGMPDSPVMLANYAIPIGGQIRAYTKDDALGNLRLWLNIDFCSSNQAFSISQLKDADAGGSLTAGLLQTVLMNVLPWSVKSGIDREVAKYQNSSIDAIQARTNAIQKKLGTSDPIVAYRKSYCGG